MRVQFILFFMILCQMPSVFPSMFGICQQYSVSKTVIKTRNLNQYNMPFTDSQIDNARNSKANQKININIIAMGAHSTDETFGCEFAIDRKENMQIAGDNTPYKLSRDLRAEFIGGTDQTVANMNLAAFQDLYGVRFFIQIPFWRLWDTDFFNDWFLSIRSSFVSIAQKLQMTLSGNNFQDISNIYDFFSKHTAQGKIDNETKRAIGFENITISLDGIYKSRHDNLQIYYYSGVEIPTGSTYSSPYLFPPVIGNNGNIGLLLGADFHGYFVHNDTQRIGVLFEIEDHFLLYKTVGRTFDLYNTAAVDLYSSKYNRNKPWSRYLPVTSQKLILGDATVSLTSSLPVRMHECNVLDISLGLLYEQKKNNDTMCYFAVGYNLWMSQPEYAELQDRVYCQEYQNFYSSGIAGFTPGSTAHMDTIAQRAPDDITPHYFSYNTLDLGSVSADGGYSQSVFFRGTVVSCCGYSLLLGGFYEFGKALMVSSRIGGWIGGGYEF